MIYSGKMHSGVTVASLFPTATIDDCYPSIFEQNHKINIPT